MTYPLTKEDIRLIVQALQLINNDAALSLRERLLSHYSSCHTVGGVVEWQSPFSGDQNQVCCLYYYPGTF
jgi:hypothetical protein